MTLGVPEFLGAMAFLRAVEESGFASGCIGQVQDPVTRIQSPGGGRSSDRRGSEVVLEVKDNGRGIPSERLAHLFNPTFRVEGGRVAATNWGLFISRSIKLTRLSLGTALF